MTIFSKPWLIKIIMTCVSIKPEVKKDTIVMTTTTNGACIGWLDENCYLMGRNDTFNSGRCEIIKGNFTRGRNK